MPNYHDYLVSAKTAYEHNDYLSIIQCLEPVEYDEDCKNQDKLAASKLRAGFRVKLISLAVTEEERRHHRVHLQEEFLLQNWYEFTLSPEYSNATYFSKENMAFTADAKSLRSTACPRSLESASVLDPANKSRDVVVGALVQAENKKKKSKNSSEKLFSKAQNCLKEDNISEALDILLRIIQNHPNFWQAYFECMRIYFVQKQFEKLKPMCELLIAKIPRDTDSNNNTCFYAYYYLARINIIAKQFPLAIALLDHAKQLKPKAIELLLAYGNIAKLQFYSCHLCYTLAEDKLTVCHDPDQAQLRISFAQNSIKCYEAAFELCLDDLETIESLADIHFQMGNWEQASKYNRMLLEHDPSLWLKASSALAAIAFENKQYEFAFLHYKAIIEDQRFMNLNSALKSDFHFLCAVLYEKLEKYSDAIREFRNAMLLDFSNLPATFACERLIKLNLSKTASSSVPSFIQKPEKALQVFQMLINVPSTPPSMRAYVIGLCGQVYAKLKNIDSALMCYQLSDTIFPHSTVEKSAVAWIMQLRQLRVATQNLTQIGLLSSNNLLAPILNQSGSTCLPSMSSDS